MCFQYIENKVKLMRKEDTVKQRRKTLRIMLITMIVLLLILSSTYLTRLLILFSFIVINFIFAFLKKRLPKFRLGKYLLGIELILFCTVMTSITFGPRFGAVMGGLLMIVNYIAERRASRYFAVTIALYTLIGHTVYYFRNYDIVTLGIITTLLYNLVVTLIIFIFPFGENKTTVLIFNLVNILFNVFLFSTVGNFVKNLLI